jgi:hypothetical protein
VEQKRDGQTEDMDFKILFILNNAPAHILDYEQVCPDMSDLPSIQHNANLAVTTPGWKCQL